MDTTVVKAARILEAIIASNEPRGVSELSRELKFTKSNISRVLSTLTALGYTFRESGTGRYGPTLRIWELGTKIMGRQPVKRAAQPLMRALQKETKETIFLSVLVGFEIMYIDKHDSEYPVRASSPVGARAPICFTATGKAILAFQPETFVRQAIRFAQGLSDKRVIDPAGLVKELAQIRKEHISMSYGIWSPGVQSLAAPVTGVDGQVIAALGISGPAERMTRKKLKDLSPLLLNTAMRLSEAVQAVTLSAMAQQPIPHPKKRAAG